ncbi:uncharacterized protein [Narcine bancroftii]|uniref:uncharacterized protein n=1 Tax=Narcine bancroftii TaxID=1343680 RepID=UPI003831D88B
MKTARPIPLPVNRGPRAARPIAPLGQRSRQAVPTTQCNAEQEKIMAEELLKVMNFAASKIQALWRGYCTRKQLYIEQGAAILLQALWRGYQVRRRLQEPVSRPLRIHCQYLLWDPGSSESLSGPKRDIKRAQAADKHPTPQQLPARRDPQVAGDFPSQTPLPIKPLCRLPYPIRQAPAHRLSHRQLRNQAATTLQAHWKGYLARRDLAIKIGAAIYIQSFFRAYRVRRNLNPTPEPQPEPLDEESEMVSFNMSFTPGHPAAKVPIPGSHQSHGSSFWICPDNGPSRGFRTSSVSRPEYTLSGKSHTFQATRARYVPAWPPGSREENGHRPPPSTTQRAQNSKRDDFVPDYFTQGAGDSRFGVDMVFCSVPATLRSARALKEHGMNLESRFLCEEEMSRPECMVTRPRFAYGEPVAEPTTPAPVSRYFLPSSPYTSGTRKLILDREPVDSQLRSVQETDISCRRALEDFDQSNLEVPGEAAVGPPEAYPSKRLREESAAAGTIQEAFKGLRTHRKLQKHDTAASKDQAIIRSSPTMKENEKEGISPLVSAKAPILEPGAQAAPDNPCSSPDVVTGPWKRERTGNIVQAPPAAGVYEQEAPVLAPLCSAGVPVHGSASSTPGCRDGRSNHIDHWARRCLRTRRQQQERTRAASIIQAAWRGHQARHEIAGQARAAAKIQALFRGDQIRKLLGSIGKHPEVEEGGSSEGDPQTLSGDNPENVHLHRSVARDLRTGEVASRRAQLKAEGPAIWMKRNACYNPRKVTIHVKASAAEIGTL